MTNIFCFREALSGEIKVLCSLHLGIRVVDQGMALIQMTASAREHGRCVSGKEASKSPFPHVWPLFDNTR